jgi:hypothetical protein
VKVTPIIAPNVDWRGFVTEAHAALKRSPIASLAMVGMKAGPLKTIIPALGEFQHEHTPAIPFLKGRDSDRVLDHLYVSFMVEAEEAVIGRLCAQCWLQALTPDDCRTVVILTGSLKEWRQMVIAGSRLHLEPGVRAVANEIHRYLLVAGLGDLFSDCTARKQTDGTIVLEINKR